MKFARFAAVCGIGIALAIVFASCAGNVTPPDTTAETTAKQSENTTETEVVMTETETETETEEIKPEVKTITVCAPSDKTCRFTVVYDMNGENPPTAEVNMLSAMIRNYTGVKVKTKDSSKGATKEIVFSSLSRAETAEMMEELEEGEYAVRVVDVDGDGRILIATTTYGSAYACAEYLLETYYTRENGFCLPVDLDIKGKEKNYRLVETGIKKLRDPFVLVEDGVYYAYGTGWKCYKNSGGKLKGPWEKVDVVTNMAHPETDGGSHWAPEVHKYNGSYYMFTTYLNSKTNHRGCIIMKADSPEGPFTEITDGHITPNDWDCIDGTFYVDPDGQPWMVFVHEWTSMKDGIGSFAAAKLSDDLTHFISEPIELFKAKDPVWATAGVTDGCFMYTTQTGELLMIWSNFDEFGYSVAVARSDNGRLDGQWTHDGNLLYSKYMTNGYDGGHGMIFTNLKGQMFLAFHSPNTETEDRKEKPVFLAIEERDGKLVWTEKTEKSE